MAKVTLRSGHVQPLWAGHPWVYKQAIDTLEGAPAAGDVVSVFDPRGNLLGRGFWSPGSAIPIRLLSRQEDDLDAGFLRTRIEEAFEFRQTLGLPSEETSGFRLVHAEGDRLPGLIVDVYGSVAAVQFLTAGMKRREERIVGALHTILGAQSILEIGSGRVTRAEGFESETRVVRGPPIDRLRFTERGFEFEAIPASGQKTGFFFDQRLTRNGVESFARGKRVLDVCTYVGAFALAAARGEASEVLAIDSSVAAIAAAGQHAAHAGLDSRIAFQKQDARRGMEALAQDKRRFDLIVLDPPKLVPSSRHLAAGRRAYQKLNRLACGLLAPGGMLVTCSCSAAMKLEDFLRTISMAARQAGRDLLVSEIRSQGPDHPTPGAFPEGRYLKAVIARVP